MAGRTLLHERGASLIHARSSVRDLGHQVVFCSTAGVFAWEHRAKLVERPSTRLGRCRRRNLERRKGAWSMRSATPFHQRNTPSFAKAPTLPTIAELLCGEGVWHNKLFHICGSRWLLLCLQPLRHGQNVKSSGSSLDGISLCPKRKVY